MTVGKRTELAAMKRRAAESRKWERAMRRAFLNEHPGRPLPEHLCELENPYPGHKRWCAAALRWINAYENEHPL